MAETKYGKYIITDFNTQADSIGTRIYCLHGGIFEGAPAGSGPRTMATDRNYRGPHAMK